MYRRARCEPIHIDAGDLLDVPVALGMDDPSHAQRGELAKPVWRGEAGLWDSEKSAPGPPADAVAMRPSPESGRASLQTRLDGVILTRADNRGRCWWVLTARTGLP
jgi:hypothetical protein